MKSIICILALVASITADQNDLQKILNDGNDRFTARMFSEIVKANPGKSVIVSPFSVMSPLAQLALASTGDAQTELFSAIGLPDENTTKAVFTDVSRQFRSVKGIELKMATKIYVADGYHLNNEFAALSKSVFDSDIQSLNFIKNQEAADIINAWVEDHTNHRIQKVVDPNTLNGDTRSVLVNAIYFKGSWKDKFSTELTQNRPFHVTKEKTIQVPTMQKQDSFLYGESSELDAKLIKIPYEGEESYLFVILPNEIDGISSLEEKLKDPKILADAENHMYSTDVMLYLPKFKIETTTNLKEVLKMMNVNKLFTLDAHLDNLLQETNKLYVSDATQKAFIEVNEEGAEAAAANEFGIAYLSAVISRPLSFKADHPFLFYLYQGNTILFSGAVKS